MQPESTKKPSKPVAMLAGIGSEMVGFTLLGVFADWLFGALPVFTVLLTVAGLALAMWHLMTWAKRRSRT